MCHRDTFGFFMLHKTTAQMRLHVIRGECLHRRRYLCSFKWWDNHHRDNKSRRVAPSIKTRLCVRDRDSLRRHGSRSASWQRHVSIASCHYRNSQIIVTIHHLTEDNLPQIFLNILYPDPDLDILIFRYYLSTLSAMAARWNSFQNTQKTLWEKTVLLSSSIHKRRVDKFYYW